MEANLVMRLVRCGELLCGVTPQIEVNFKSLTTVHITVLGLVLAGTELASHYQLASSSRY
jgi:hypothetical protein